MKETEALNIAWSVIRDNGLEKEVTGLKSIRFTQAAEEHEVLGVDDPDLVDKWCVSFSLVLEEGVLSQEPDDFLVTIDDRTGKATVVYQM